MNRGLYISAGLLEAKHKEKIGPALWEFLWLISHETKQDGKILNGSPVTAVRIATELGEHKNTAKINLTRLEGAGYITRARLNGLPYEYRIAHSKKWKPGKGDTENSATVVQETVPGSHTKRYEGRTENGAANKEVDKVDIKRQVDKERVRPSFAEVSAYCQERGDSVDPQKWFDHYSANGWKVGRNPMKDWKAAVRTWERNGVNNGNGNGSRAAQRHASGKPSIEERMAAEMRIARDFAARTGS